MKYAKSIKHIQAPLFVAQTKQQMVRQSNTQPGFLKLGKKRKGEKW